MRFRPPPDGVWLGFLYALAHFDDLHRARLGVGFDAPALCPAIGVIVVPNEGHQHAGSGLVQDQPDVAVDPRGPEVGVLGLVDAVHLKSGR